MAARSLSFLGDPVLLATATPVARFDGDLITLIDDMFDTMYAEQGRGLAAPQVGVSQRVFVVDVTWKEGVRTPMAFVNPSIVARAPTTQIGTEACLSIPNRVFEVRRPEWVDMTWMTPEGATEKQRFDGIEAVCLCHELDHLNGVLITESGTEV